MLSAHLTTPSITTSEIHLHSLTVCRSSTKEPSARRLRAHTCELTPISHTDPSLHVPPSLHFLIMPVNTTGLRAIFWSVLYGVDKIPDTWFDKIPYYQSEEAKAAKKAQQEMKKKNRHRRRASADASDRRHHRNHDGRRRSYEDDDPYGPDDDYRRDDSRRRRAEAFESHRRYDGAGTGDYVQPRAHRANEYPMNSSGPPPSMLPPANGNGYQAVSHPRRRHRAGLTSRRPEARSAPSLITDTSQRNAPFRPVQSRATSLTPTSTTARPPSSATARTDRPTSSKAAMHPSLAAATHPFPATATHAPTRSTRRSRASTSSAEGTRGTIPTRTTRRTPAGTAIIVKAVPGRRALPAATLATGMIRPSSMKDCG